MYMVLLTSFIYNFFTGIPNPSMKLSVNELVISCLPDILHSVAAVGIGAVEADAVIPFVLSRTERFGNFSRPFTPVTATERCNRED